MEAKRKIEIGKVYSGEVGGSWLPIKVEKSLGHGRYEAQSLPSGKTVKVSTDAIKGDGQTLEQWTASTTPKEHDLPAPPKGEKIKKARAKKEPKGPRQSLTNAAILVLADATQPMNAKAIVEKATADGMYKPGDGKTPEATLYSAMLRDKKERFQKADRGVWTLTAAGKAEVDAIRQAFAAKKGA